MTSVGRFARPHWCRLRAFAGSAGQAGAPHGLAAAPLRRFRNQGNSCYVNTALQVLGGDTMLLTSLREHRCDRHCVACWLRHDLVDFPSEPFEPLTSVMRKAFERPGTARWSQRNHEDCGEFVGAIQGLLDATEAAEPVSSAFHASFGFRLEEQRRCDSCHGESDWAPIADRDVCVFPLYNWRQGDTVQAAFDRQFAWDHVGDSYVCPNPICSAVGSTHKRIRVRECSATVILSVQRTHYDSGTGRRLKKGDDLDVSRTLQIQGEAGVRVYDLDSIGLHKGHSLDGGHWVTWRRATTVGQSDQDAIDDDEVRRAVREDDRLGSQACVMVYRRQAPGPGMPAASSVTTCSRCHAIHSLPGPSVLCADCRLDVAARRAAALRAAGREEAPGPNPPAVLVVRM